MKSEIRQPDGTTVARDSANPEHARDMAEFLNKPIVVVRVDGQGRLVEVKEARPGSAARLHAELPFRLTLPDAGPNPGQSWDRTFPVKLDPPHGTGESYEYVQKYTCKDAKDGLAVVAVETALKAPPKTAGEQVPLVPMLWGGEVYFNVGSSSPGGATAGSPGRKPWVSGSRRAPRSPNPEPPLPPPSFPLFSP